MYDPKVGQWLSEDPIRFEGIDPNLRRYVGNVPTMATDPTGLFAFYLGAPITLPPHGDYAGYPLEVFEFFAVVYDALLEFKQELAVGVLLNAQTEDNVKVMEAMQKYCDKKYGPGWKVVAVEFRLTGLKFYNTTKSGGKAGEPRREVTHIPVVIKRKGSAEIEYQEIDTTKAIPLAHFFIEGYWIFKFVNEAQKKESGLIALSTEGKLHTYFHAPYDKECADQVNAIRERLMKDTKIEWFYFGRFYDRVAFGWGKKKTLAIGDIFKFLKVVPGANMGDVTVITIGDIDPGLTWPK